MGPTGPTHAEEDTWHSGVALAVGPSSVPFAGLTLQLRSSAENADNKAPVPRLAVAIQLARAWELE